MEGIGQITQVRSQRPGDAEPGRTLSDHPQSRQEGRTLRGHRAAASPRGAFPTREATAQESSEETVAMVCRCARHQDTTRIARAVLEEAGLVAPVSEEREMDRLARECIARSLPPADMGREHYPLEIDRDWTRS